MKQKVWLLKLFQRRFVIILLLLLQIAFIAYSVVANSRQSEIIRNVLTAVSFFVALHVMTSRGKGAYKNSLIFLILLFPLFGGFFYLFFKLQIGFRRMHKRFSEVERETRPYFSISQDALDRAIAAAPEHSTQIRYLDSCAGFPVYADTKTEYFPLGEDMFAALAREIAEAKRYIFLEYFIIHVGKMWDELYVLLEEKAKAGVDVRIIYDDVGCFLGLPIELTKKGKTHIKYAPWSKFVPFLSGTQNNRDHRKIAVIDGVVAFTGGINLADEYINHLDRFGHWKDTAVMLKGPAAWSFTVMFLQMWSLCKNKKETPSDYYPDSMPVFADSGFTLPYADSPTDYENVGEHVYTQIITSAKKYVYITTPYLIIDDSMVSTLSLAAKSGVDVRIITPHRYDKFWVHVTTRSYYRRLLRAGVKIYEYTPGFMHAKSFVSDDTTATVGTTNMDFRSFYFHFECGVWMYKTEAVESVKRDFLETLEKCRPLTERDCHKNSFIRIIEAILRVFAPLM